MEQKHVNTGSCVLLDWILVVSSPDVWSGDETRFLGCTAGFGTDGNSVSSSFTTVGTSGNRYYD